MKIEDVLKITRNRLRNAEKAYEVDYYETIEALYEDLLKEQKVTVFCGVNKDGLTVSTYKIPMLNKNTRYSSILAVIGEVIRRLGIRYSNYISSYFKTREQKICKFCEHRAEYMAHGFICGLAVGAVLMILEGLVICL